MRGSYWSLQRTARQLHTIEPRRIDKKVIAKLAFWEQKEVRYFAHESDY